MMRRQDKWALGGIIALVMILCVVYVRTCDHGMTLWEFMWRSRRAGAETNDAQHDNYDPDLYLGIPIGTTRYRFNHSEGYAIAMQQVDFTVDWIIPPKVVYDGVPYEVTAVDTFALIRNPKLRRVTFPHTARHLNCLDVMPTHPITIIKE